MPGLRRFPRDAVAIAAIVAVLVILAASGPGAPHSVVDRSLASTAHFSPPATPPDEMGVAMGLTDPNEEATPSPSVAPGGEASKADEPSGAGALSAIPPRSSGAAPGADRPMESTNPGTTRQAPLPPTPTAPRPPASDDQGRESPQPAIPATNPTADPIAFGAYVHGAPWSNEPRRAFEQMLGRPLAIVMWYQTWGSGGASQFDPAMMDRAAAGGALPMLTWVPESSTSFSLDQVIAGKYDDYLRSFAQAAAAWGRPFLLRPMHEMNGDWHVWSPGVNHNTAADYVAAWRHLHDMFASEGAGNVRWVWSPNTYVDRTQISFGSIYPGHAYVDWMALDGYNNGPTQAWSTWTSFTEEFGASYDALIRLSGKPLMIAEVASCESGGDKAAWINSMLLNEIPSRFDRVRAVVWFQQDKECDWRLNSSPTSLAAAREALAQDLWDGRID